MINLCLVVIATQFSETKQREHQLMQEQRAQCLSSSTLASMAEPGDCYEEIFQLVCHVLRKAKRRSAALYYTLRGKTPPAAGGRGNRRGGGNGNGERHHSRHPKSELEGLRDGLGICNIWYFLFQQLCNCYICICFSKKNIMISCVWLVLCLWVCLTACPHAIVAISWYFCSFLTVCSRTSCGYGETQLDKGKGQFYTGIDCWFLNMFAYRLNEGSLSLLNCTVPSALFYFKY